MVDVMSKYKRDNDYPKPPKWGKAYQEFFPNFTCPSSRHTKTICEALRDPKSPVRRLLIDAGYEPDHWAHSMETTVLCLWQSRKNASRPN